MQGTWSRYIEWTRTNGMYEDRIPKIMGDYMADVVGFVVVLK